MCLQKQLEELTSKLRTLVPADRLAIIDSAIEALKTAGISDHSLRQGDRGPTFALPDGDGRIWHSADLLSPGPLVIVFYRGRWCAYCNAQLVALQRIYQQIVAIGASLLAVSPQTQKHSYMTRDMHKLRFPVLSDAGNQIARKFGLVYRVAPPLQALYEAIYTRLPGYNGDQSWELPLPATYIVGSDGTIAYARVDADWRQRPEPTEILGWLRSPDHSITDDQTTR